MLALWRARRCHDAHQSKFKIDGHVVSTPFGRSMVASDTYDNWIGDTMMRHNLLMTSRKKWEFWRQCQGMSHLFAHKLQSAIHNFHIAKDLSIFEDLCSVAAICKLQFTSHKRLFSLRAPNHHEDIIHHDEDSCDACSPSPAPRFFFRSKE